MPKTEKVQTFNHVRKGLIVGVVTWTSDDKEWFDIRLVGDQKIGYASIEGRLTGPTDDGETVRVRASLVTEVTDG